VVTTIEPLEVFYMGEEYHQDFFAKNPGQGYCNMVVLPKMVKTRKAFEVYAR
jgi:peptide-methionine (S)-S-oxide reductase